MIFSLLDLLTVKKVLVLLLYVTRYCYHISLRESTFIIPLLLSYTLSLMLLICYMHLVSCVSLWLWTLTPLLSLWILYINLRLQNMYFIAWISRRSQNLSILTLLILFSKRVYKNILSKVLDTRHTFL